MHNKKDILHMLFFLFFITTNSLVMTQKITEALIDKPDKVLNSGHHTIIGGAAFLLQNKKIISVNGYSEINIWNFDSGAQEKIGWNFEKKSWQRNYSIILVPNYSGRWHYFSVAVVDPTEQVFAVGGLDGSILIWDTKALFQESEKAPQPIAALSEHANQISSLKFTPSGMLLSTSWDSFVILWYYDTMKKTMSPRVFDTVVDSVALCADITPNEMVLFAGYFDGNIRLWYVFENNNKANKSLAFKAHNDPVRAVLVSNDGKHLFSGSNDGFLKIWDLLANCKLVMSINLCCGWILSLLQLDAKHIIVGCQNGVARVLQCNDNRTEWKTIKNFSCESVGIVSMQLSASKEFITVTDEAGKIYVWKNPLFVRKSNG